MDPQVKFGFDFIYFMYLTTPELFLTIPIENTRNAAIRVFLAEWGLTIEEVDDAVSFMNYCIVEARSLPQFEETFDRILEVVDQDQRTRSRFLIQACSIGSICLLHPLFSKEIIQDRGIEFHSLDMLQERLGLSGDEMDAYKRKGLHLAKRFYDFGEIYAASKSD